MALTMLMAALTLMSAKARRPKGETGGGGGEGHGLDDVIASWLWSSLEITPVGLVAANEHKMRRSLSATEPTGAISRLTYGLIYGIVSGLRIIAVNSSGILCGNYEAKNASCELLRYVINNCASSLTRSFSIQGHDKQRFRPCKMPVT